MARLLKKHPKRVPKGHCVVIHYVPHAYHWVTWPATASKPERQKLCHVVKGYSIQKQKPFDPTEHKTPGELLGQLEREIKNVKKAK